MNNYDPALQECFTALTFLFPSMANRISQDALPRLVAVDMDTLKRLDWITLKDEPGLGQFYAPAGDLLAHIQAHNPHLGALGKEEMNIDEINRQRLGSWRRRLFEQNSTPLLMIGIGHKSQLGQLLVLTPEEITDEQVILFLRKAADMLEAKKNP